MFKVRMAISAFLFFLVLFTVPRMVCAYMHSPVKQLPTAIKWRGALTTCRCCLTILCLFFFFSVMPTLLATTTPVQVLQGNPALLAVTVQGPVNPSLVKDNFVWTFEGTQQNTMNILENGNLSLTSVQPSQTGDYTCTAVNSAGSGSTTVRLEVLGEILAIAEKNRNAFESFKANVSLSRQLRKKQ